MNLYLITRTDKIGWDEYISFVACAESEDEALTITPDDRKFEYDDAWTRQENLKVALIGVADPSVSKGSVLASFNAAG